MSDNCKRETLSSRLGFILISAGCAIGLGNVWKFPWQVGQNGGALFVIIYLLFLAFVSIPILTLELSMGRASRKSVTKMYQELEPKGSKWHIHGYISLGGNYLLMMFYTVVTAWLLIYFVKMTMGAFEGLQTEQINQMFGSVVSSPKEQLYALLFIVVSGFLVCSVGLKNGVERIGRFMMVTLLLIMVFLAINNVFLEGGAEGYKFYLRPNPAAIKEHGLINILYNALSQAFFTVSVGIGSMAIFGSYVNKERRMLGEAVHITLIDTFVALMSGFIIFPACFAFGVEPTGGPDLIFKTLPNIFVNMPYGRVCGSFFFLFLNFAAYTTVLALFESITCNSMELFNISRRKSSIINCVLMFVLALPCLFGNNIWSHIQPMGAGSSILDLEDFIVSNLMLPIGCLIFALFCSLRYGWGWDKFVEEANTGKGMKVLPCFAFYFKYILPVVIFIVIVLGLIYKFC